jgi:hypothetical protein
LAGRGIARRAPGRNERLAIGAPSLLDDDRADGMNDR